MQSNAEKQPGNSRNRGDDTSNRGILIKIDFEKKH